jgi:hypothetical protein
MADANVAVTLGLPPELVERVRAVDSRLRVIEAHLTLDRRSFRVLHWRILSYKSDWTEVSHVRSADEVCSVSLGRRACPERDGTGLGPGAGCL